LVGLLIAYCFPFVEMSPRRLEVAEDFLSSQPESRTMNDETRFAEKLKLHLLYQNKHTEAKKFVELHKKLKGMQVIKNREAVITLLYELFDKEVTRAAMSARRPISRTDINNTTSDERSTTTSSLSISAAHPSYSSEANRSPTRAGADSTVSFGSQRRVTTARTSSSQVVLIESLISMNLVSETCIRVC
jgi:hypothetical protein